jgi:hypothetical protein
MTFRPGRLVCPHCGYDGTTPPQKHQDYDSTPFFWLEDATAAWKILAVNGDAIQATETYDLRDDWFNARIQCASCFGEFPVPEGKTSDFIEPHQANWGEGGA